MGAPPFGEGICLFISGDVRVPWDPSDLRGFMGCGEGLEFQELLLR